uniref:Copper-exporting ATPase n=1 Tax=Sedum alfredii TaxID=439688 RepID=A0A650AVJ4_9MAGN|nr:Copper-exporting ATPase [Sedum alfredii]
MAPDLQLTQLRRHHEDQDEEDVRLLDSYDLETGAGEHSQPLLFQRLQIRITGMTCAACSNSVESALTSLNGVVSASVALLQNKAEVLFDPSVVKVEDVVEAVEDAGFEAEIIPQSSTAATTNQDTKSTADATLVGQFSIGGMTCAACVNSVEGILRALPGVKRAVVALATSLGEVEYDPSVISKDDIVNAIEDAGFDGSLVQSNTQDKIVLTIAGVLNELDVRYLEGVLANLKGVRQFFFDRISGDLEVLFDPEVLSSRNLVDGIQGGSGERFNVHVRNPFT